jgi:hypothetical protein
MCGEAQVNIRTIGIVALMAVVSASTVHAAGNPLLGSWKVTGSIIAPWYDGNGASPVVDPELAGKTITFSSSSASGSRVVECSKVIYTIMTVGPDYLFEGNLKQPTKDAAALGFKSDKISSVNVSCDWSVGDMELDFPMVDKDTILLGINNRIYTLRRIGQ